MAKNQEKIKEAGVDMSTMQMILCKTDLNRGSPGLENQMKNLVKRNLILIKVLISPKKRSSKKIVMDVFHQHPQVDGNPSI